MLVGGGKDHGEGETIEMGKGESTRASLLCCLVLGVFRYKHARCVSGRRFSHRGAESNPGFGARGGTPSGGGGIPSPENVDASTGFEDASDSLIVEEVSGGDDASVSSGELPDSETPDSETVEEEPLCAEGESYCAPSLSCCTAEETCWSYGCQKPGLPCQSDEECSGDTYCDGESGSCIPWGTGPKGTLDLSCSKTPTPGVFFPKLQCEWQGLRKETLIPSTEVSWAP